MIETSGSSTVLLVLVVDSGDSIAGNKCNEASFTSSSVSDTSDWDSCVSEELSSVSRSPCFTKRLQRLINLVHLS